MKTCIWESLPPEILSQIFLQLDDKDLVYSVSLVCKTWNNQLQQPQFWRRRMKYFDIPINQIVWKTLVNYETNGVLCYFLKTLVFLAQGFLYKGVYEFQYEEGGRWEVSEEYLIIPAAFLMLRTPYKLILEIKNSIRNIKYFQLFSTILRYKKCRVELRDINGWRTCDSSDDIIMKLMEPMMLKIIEFKGCLSNIMLMPQDVTVLCLSLSDDEQAVTILPELCNLKSLNYITLHIPSGSISLDSIVKCLPEMKYWGGSRTRLFISNAKDEDAEWIVEVVQRLMPPSCGYSWLVFTSCQLTLPGWQKVLEGMSSKATIVGMLAVSPRRSVTPFGEEHLNKYLGTYASYPYSPYEPGVHCEDYTSIHIYDSDSDIFDW